MLVLFLSLWIVFGNLLVLAYIYSKNRSKWGFTRASLAVADMATGEMNINSCVISEPFQK